MLMSNISLDTSSPGAPGGDPAAGAPALVPDGEGFAGQLAQAQSAVPPGQNLAAGALPLQTLALGPALEVITSSSDTEGDSDSLAEFAKSQGLDDDVVAWLFSDSTQAQIQAQALMPIPLQAPGGVMALPVAPSGAAGLTTSSLLTTPAPVVLPGTPTLPQDPGVLAAATADPEMVSAAAVTTAGWLQNQQASLLAKESAATPAATPQDPAQALVPIPMPASLQAAWASARPQRPDAAPLAPPFSVQDADRPVEILSLDIQEGLEALWDSPQDPTGSDTAGNGAGHGATHNLNPGTAAGAAATAAADDAAPITTVAQRAAGYEELSQRLGEAMAKRVLSQIERGNWEIKLLLKPAKLGEVEIDLSMRSGALDAAFRATNPLTRDLLNDGLPRLREVLAHAGMDIAGLNVGNGRNPQSGGNPTPRQARGPDEGTSAGTAPVAAAPVAQPRLRNPGSGWDVLV